MLVKKLIKMISGRVEVNLLGGTIHALHMENLHLQIHNIIQLSDELQLPNMTNWEYLARKGCKRKNLVRHASYVGLRSQPNELGHHDRSGMGLPMYLGPP